jgi:pullulanase-type alpha-1,6-glucosidase
MPAPASVALVGDLQSELGCPGDWQPECAQTELLFDAGVWTNTFNLPVGNWQYKVALNDSWDENYGDVGAQNGPNIVLVLPAPAAVTFTYDPDTHQVYDDVQPLSVTVAGSLQSELGCPGDWQADCAATQLAYDAADGVWQGVFAVPAGAWEYKATLNGSWDVNYGANATNNGANIGFSLAAPADVKFYFDDDSRWITSSENAVIATAPGSYQSELGCPGDWQPDCLRSWLKDPDGDGIYTFSTRALPAGDYEVKVALNESWDINYGAGGVQNGPNIAFTVLADNDQVVFIYDSTSHVLTVGGDQPIGNVSEARAYWLAEDTLAWNVPADSVVRLHWSEDGSLAVSPEGLVGGDSIPLTLDGVIDGAIAEKFRHLAGQPAYRIDPADLPLVPWILKQQFALSADDAGGEPRDATGIQPAGVLDDLFTYPGDLGVSWDGDTPTVRVWAPTARSVQLHLFDDSDPASVPGAVLPLTEDSATGTWTVAGDPSWDRKFYLFEVEVFVRSTGQVEHNLVTDPYSLSLALDSKRSQIVNLADADLQPRNWDKLKKPRLDAPEDIALYELHVRDFSIHDDTVPMALRGTFAAFGRPGSAGMRHLRSLAQSGLTHVHVLPAFDCASVPEDRSTHADPGDLSVYPPDSDQQQAAIEPIRDLDGFNWCYDPFHYTTPEGSYSTDPDGVQRILEFREMVAGLNQAGLRVVMDVVYNHTSGSLQGAKSVLDKIVPDYYHRLNGSGYIETSSCCANTASEHSMMEKLMLDSLRTWATAYQVDGFRFDIMGHHTRGNIENARDLLQALTPEQDGVDGSAIYLYGEGWNFGEVANNARFDQATQANMGDGTGVGSFNDRLRDAVRGGGPFDSGIDHVRRQGFINGLYTDPNAENSGSPGELDELLASMDRMRVGLAGSVEDFEFVDRNGNLVTAAEVDYFGQAAGYTSDPQEVINYIAAHDNETLFDIGQYKLPLGTARADRVRVQNLGNSIVALAQGVPFYHAGQDLLRSKSLDRNSYNSGDWFNLLDFSYELNGWGRGLPPFADNQANWPVAQPRLADPTLGVDTHDIRDANKHLREMLRIRNSSPLFRLRTGQDVIDRVAFHNTGPAQVPGLIVMSLAGDTGVDIVVLFNADVEAQEFHLDFGDGAAFDLHPVQQDSHDPVVRTASYDDVARTFHVPARTAAVFVRSD